MLLEEVAGSLGSFLRKCLPSTQDRKKKKNVVCLPVIPSNENGVQETSGCLKLKETHRCSSKGNGGIAL